MLFVLLQFNRPELLETTALDSIVADVEFVSVLEADLKEVSADVQLDVVAGRCGSFTDLDV